MEIELQFNSLVVRSDDIQEDCLLPFSTVAPTIPVIHRKRRRTKTKRLAPLLDSLIANIEEDMSG